MLGIDVSKHTLACALPDPATRQLLWEDTLPNSPEGIATLLDKICATTPFVVEPTGRYGQALVKTGVQAGRLVRLATPRKAKQFLASVQSRAKTDKLDSRSLALYGLACPLPPYPVNETHVDQLDQLLSARKGLVKSITNLQLQQQSLPEAASVLAPAIADLQGHLKQLDARLKEQIKQTPAFCAAARLDAVPGIGPVTAAAVTSRLVAKYSVGLNFPLFVEIASISTKTLIFNPTEYYVLFASGPVRGLLWSGRRSTPVREALWRDRFD